MLLEQHLLQLFGNLPYLPKAEVTKHLDYLDLIKATLVSERWDKAVERRRNDDVARNETPILHFHMIMREDRVKMRILERHFGSTEKLIIDFPVESALKNSPEIVEDGDRVICRSENFADFENRILATFHEIRTLFHVVICDIQMNLDLGLNLEFLKKLRLEKLDIFELSGDKNNCQVDSKELTDLMDTWDIGDSVQIKIETIGKFEGNSRMLRGTWYWYCEFADSRWITSDIFIDKFNGKGGILKRCRLTSEDFNAYFKEWKNTERYVGTLECHMEHEVDIEKVLEGLEAKKWNPMVRGRAFRKYDDRAFFIELAAGMDISRKFGFPRTREELATIHISADKKVIRFLPWLTKFSLLDEKKRFIEIIERLKPKLEQFSGCRRERARMAEEVEYYEAKLRSVNEQIARENH